METVSGIERGSGGGVLRPPSTFGTQRTPNTSLGVGPNAPALTKARDKAPVIGQEYPDAVLGEPGFLNEGVDIGQKFAHAEQITRDSVQVNTRYNVRAEYALACYK